MESSPKGREIDYVEGSPDGIIERGEAIKTLGDKMLHSADVLEGVKSRALEHGGQQGKAIEKLREAIGDSYTTLREAGELYQPVGPVISAYGNALDSVQPSIKAAVDDSRDLWDTYASLPGSVDPRGAGGWFQPDEGSPEAELQAEEDAAKKAAYDAWEERAGDFDAHYDTWEDAFDLAVSGVSDELSGSIKDGFWDNIGPVVDFLKNVVDIAALIVGVVALFAGGWVLALAAVLAFAALALTAAQYARGAASLSDMMWAGVGVLPFGKLTNLSKLAAVRTVARNSDELARGAQAYKAAGLKKFMDLGKFKEPLRALDGPLSKRLGLNKFDDVLRGYEDTLGRRLNFDDLDKLKYVAKGEQYAGNAGTVLSHYGRLKTSTNHEWSPLPDLPSVPKPVGALL